MSTRQSPGDPTTPVPSLPAGWWGPVVILVLGAVLVAGQQLRGPVLSLDGIAEAWAAITIAIAVQALPFLVLGVVVSGIISVVLPESLVRRMTPRSQFVAVPAVAACGMLLPGCECGSVPVSQSLVRRGVPDAAALAFLLASPAINPIVLVSTAVAFSGTPAMVWARFIASLAAAVLVGWAWIAFGGLKGLESHDTHEHHGLDRAERFRVSVVHDLMSAGGFLVIGAIVAGFVKVAVPTAWFDALNGTPLLGVLVMALLAVVLSLCSEADAFVAASFVQVSPTAQLVFLVVGPMIDIKLIAMQYGAWGAGFVARFVPITLVVAIVAASVVGTVLLG